MPRSNAVAALTQSGRSGTGGTILTSYTKDFSEGDETVHGSNHQLSEIPDTYPSR